MRNGELGYTSLSRRDFLRLTVSTAPVVLFRPNFLDLSDKSVNMEITPPPPREEIPNGIDMGLTPEEVMELERQWVEIENNQLVGSIREYVANVSILLNVTRARGLRSDGFVDMINQYLERGIQINGKGLNLVAEIDYAVQELSAARDGVIDGYIASSEYGVRATKLIQSLVFSYLWDIHDTGVFGPECTGANELVYTQFVPKEIAQVEVSTMDSDKKDYYAGVQDLYGNIAPNLFDISASNPARGLVQRRFTDTQELWFGDTIFKDRSSGYRGGHPLTVIEATRDDLGNLNSWIPVALFDGNVNGRMIAGVYGLGTKKEFDDIFNSNNDKFGILRTEFADDEYFLRLKNLSSIPSLNSLPVEISTGRQEIFPDFARLPDFVSLWQKFSSSSRRGEVLTEIINKVGLYVRNENGEIQLGPRWDDSFGNNYWLCNIYSTFLLMACGVTDIGHWYFNDKPTLNQGEEYDVADMFAWFNKHGRKNNWVDVTHASVEDRKKMLASGYVMYGVTRGHTWTILPLKNPEGKVVPTLSQHGYPFRMDLPNYSYKFLRPRSCHSFHPNDDPPQYNLEKTDGILWAHMLPNVQESKSPYRAALFGHNVPDTLDIKSNSEDTGWLTSVRDIKMHSGEIVSSGVKGFLESILDLKHENLPTGNHIFQYAFDLVKTIQRYRLPLNTPPEKDAEEFVSYLKKSLAQQGYKKLLRGSYAEAIFRNIQYGFVTREESLRTGRPFQPLQCFGLVQLLDLGRGEVEWAPARAGGLVSGNAQEIAHHLLTLPQYGNRESLVGKDTAIHFEKDNPQSLEQFRAGDTFYISYSGPSQGHTGTILTDPFLDKSGKLSVAVADSNRLLELEGEGIKFVADGMPRIRIMNYELFTLNYLVGRDLRVNSQMVLLRPNSKK